MKARRGVVLGAAALSVVGMVAAYRLGKARADGVPAMNPLYYGGVLSDGGRPVEGVRAVTVRLWDAATAGAAVCTTSAAGTAFTGGRFRVALDAACVGAVRANPELWAEVQVEGTTFPRSKLGAVPYALEAGRAVSAAGATGALEARIAAVEGRTATRQVVIGSWRPATPTAVTFPVICPTTPPPATSYVRIGGEPFSLTFTASSAGLYRVSAPAENTVALGFTRLASSVPAALVFDRSEIGDRLEAVFRLETGREYSFFVEMRADVACRTSPATEFFARRPMMAEQLE